MKWISIQENLPPLGVPLFATIYDRVYFKSKVLFPVYYIKKPYEEGYEFAFEQFDNILDLGTVKLKHGL